MPLFKAPLEEVTKSAAVMTKLPPSPEEWPSFIYQKALEALPELANFALDIAFDHQDIAQATAVGAVLISLKQPPSLDIMGQVRSQSPGRTARVPVLILHGEMFPLDLLVAPGMHGMPTRLMPLNARRLHSVLFREDIFQTTSQAPGPNNIASLLYPSSRDTFYGGNSSVTQKMASLLEDVIVEGGNRESLLRKVASLPDFADNPAAKEAMATLLTARAAPPPTVEWEPSVVKVSSLGEGVYAIQQANPACWEPRVMEVTRDELVKIASPDLINMVDTDGEATITPEVMEGAEAPEEEGRELITSAGVARCETQQGMRVVGIVLPSLIDFTGMKLPIALFTNGTSHVMQPEIYGVPGGGEPPLGPEGALPQGYGLFVRRGRDGLEGTVPMHILAAVSSAQGQAWLVAGEEGSQARVKRVEGARKAFESEGVLCLPTDFQWMPLPEETVDLKGKPEASPLGMDLLPGGHDPLSELPEGPEELKLASRSFQLRYLGSDSWTARGPFLEKVGGQYDLDESQMVFLLNSAGFSTKKAASVMVKCATEGGPISLVAGVPQLTPPSDWIKAAHEKKARATPRGPDLPRGIDLDAGIKVAAELQDSSSIDALLGMSLLTPDNTHAFVSHLPEMEKTLSLLCEMLLGSRLGLKVYDEASLEKAVQGLEVAIENTYALRFQEGAPTLR